MISDIEAEESLNNLADYCLEHLHCKDCIFKPKNYMQVKNECLFSHSEPPCDLQARYKREYKKEGK